MNDAKLIKLIADALEVQISDLVSSLQLDPEENWDSIAHLSVITSADRILGVELDLERLAGCRSVQDLYDLLSSYVNV